NTMPMRARNLGSSVLGAPTDTPSTMISPFWNGSSPLTVLMSVDFPEPEGPHTTTTSPLATWRLQLSSTWVEPYHLLTCFNSIMCIPVLMLSGYAIAFTQMLHTQRRRVAHDEVDNSNEHVHFNQTTVALCHFHGRSQEVGERKHIDKRGVL